MFKLESYITPLLMGYLDKYVKLRHEDFQLSLWGGDAVLSNLDLRLDELEKVLQLPVVFQSGHIHELRLHVPWTKLGSEPVVVTINTVECIVKVRDRAYNGSSTSQSSEAAAKAAQQKSKVKKRQQDEKDLPPGYLQSIVNRIINNVSFVFNNLILKFVEDDIVLSVNIKSAECYSVDRDWNRAFVDLVLEDLALRKVINFGDLTMCLDKTNASGHIESYQEPIAYRCAVTCRLHMSYDSVTAKFPKATRFNVYCDTLNLCLTDTQLPMFVRLIELFIAMYYGYLDIPSAAEHAQSSTSVDPQTDKYQESMSPDIYRPGLEMEDGRNDGWASWAWSYVPQILPSDEALEEEGGRSRRGPTVPPILSIGFYFHQVNIVFKLTERAKDGSEMPHKKIHFHPFLTMAFEGASLEVLIQGLLFCDVQSGLTACRIYTNGNCICGVADEEVARCNTLLRAGECLDQKMKITYLSNSLFDATSFENQGHAVPYILDRDIHLQTYTEQYGLTRYGAYWQDYLYTFEKPERQRMGAGSNSSDTDQTDAIFDREFSNLRFLLGDCHVTVSSTFYHRLAKFISCMWDPQYEPYGAGKNLSDGSEDRPKPTEEQIQSVEDFIPTQLVHLALINPTVTIITTEHPECNAAKKNYRSRHRKKDSKKEDPHQCKDLAAVVIVASRFDLQVTKPMYPGRLIRLVSAIAGPSSNLLHHCHRHTQIKLFGLQMGLQRTSANGKVTRPLTLVPPCSFALYFRYLVLPKLWHNSSLALSEWMFEIPNASLNTNKASIIMASQVLSTWLTPRASHTAGWMEDSLLDDLFPVSGESTKQAMPLLELSVCGVEFKSCSSTLVDACTASLSSVQMVLYTPGVGGKMSVVPILCGPSNTSQLTKVDFFTKKEGVLASDPVTSDCVTMTLQKPKNTTVREAPALALVDCQGMAVWLDPGLMGWFHYCPQPRPLDRGCEGQQGQQGGQLQSQTQPVISVDLTLAQITSPLNAVSQASVHSTSSPSHTGTNRPVPSSLTPRSHRDGRTSHTTPSVQKEGKREKDARGEGEMHDKKGITLGETLAAYIPLIRALHLQVDIKPSVLFLPKTGLPTTTESSQDLVTSVQQAFVKGRLSQTLVVCLPAVLVTSTMSKPINVLQELPIRDVQGSLIGERLPWTIRLTRSCVYSLTPGHPQPSFLVQPVEVVSTLAVNSTYSPPTSEQISSLALCLHVDVGVVKTELTTAQLHLLSVTSSQMSSLTSNISSLASYCLKMFATSPTGGSTSTTFSSRDIPSVRKSVSSSTHRIRTSSQSVQSGEVTDQMVTDISEDTSHDASPLHESILNSSEEETGTTRLLLWLQLMLPKVDLTVYHTCLQSQKESGISLTLDDLDLCLDSQSVYSKVKLNLNSFGVQHSCKGPDGSWNWTDLDGVIVTCTPRLPRNLRVVSNKLWVSDNNSATSLSFSNHHHHHQSHDAMGRDKKHGVLSVTLTRALCKNVKKRLKKANVELPSVTKAARGSIDEVEVSDFGNNNSNIGPTSFSSSQSDPGFFYFHEYLSEICLKTGPVDVVVKSQSVDILSSFLSTLGQKESSRLPEPNVNVTVPKESGMFGVAADKNISSPSSSSSSSSSTESFSVQNLPLIYADLGMMRLFVPLNNGKRTPAGEKPQTFCDKSTTPITTTTPSSVSSSSIPLPSSSMPAFTTTSTFSESKVTSSQEHTTLFSNTKENQTPPSAKTVGPSTNIQPQPQPHQYPMHKDQHASTTKVSFSPSIVDSKQSMPSYTYTNPSRSGHGSGSRRSSSGTAASGGVGVGSKIITTLDHTMVMIQLSSLNIAPHADNPLPRTAQEKWVYQDALQTGHAHQPGSSVEDRQYQVEIKGLSISTGCWDQVIQEARRSVKQHSPKGSMVQIPALDWNTFLMDGHGHERKEILLAPLASAFDVTLVIAPPVHCAPKQLGQPDCQTYLICGTTAELNVTSDLDFYLSNGQFELLSLLSTHFSHSHSTDIESSSSSSSFTTTTNTPTTEGFSTSASFKHRDDMIINIEDNDDSDVKQIGPKKGQNSNIDQHHHQQHLQQHHQQQQQQQYNNNLFGGDSGVESDVSTLTLGEQGNRVGSRRHHHRYQSSKMTTATPEVCLEGKGRKDEMSKGLIQGVDNGHAHPGQMDREKEDGFKMSSSSSPPSLLSSMVLDLLVTAGRVSVTVYTHKILQEQVTQELPLFRERRTSQRVRHQSSDSHPTTPTGLTITPTTMKTIPTPTMSPCRDNLEQRLKHVPLNSYGSHRRSVSGEATEDQENSDSNEEPFTEFNFMKQSSVESSHSLHKTIDPGSVCMLPFVYMYVTQPHCIVASHGVSPLLSKLEMACYDVLVKGASDCHLAPVEEYHMIPDCADFNVHWMETRAGRPHPYTGIPPSLLTVRMTQEQGKPNTASLSLERPLRLKVSQLAIEQTVSFAKELASVLQPPQSRPTHLDNGQNSATAAAETTSSWSPTAKTSKESRRQEFDCTNTTQELGVFSMVDRLDVSTCQLVVVMETGGGGGEADGGPSSPLSSMVGAVTSLEEFQLELNIDRTGTDTKYPSLAGHAHLKDALVKLNYEKKSTPLIGPLTVSVDTTLTWIPISVNNAIPQLLVLLETGLVMIKIGQEHVFCLTQLSSRLATLYQSILNQTTSDVTKPPPPQQYPGRSRQQESEERSPPPPCPKSEEFIQDQTHDDLRRGGFEFLEELDDTILEPSANQIVFSSHDVYGNHGNTSKKHHIGSDDDISAASDEDGYMCWKYSHPRVITSIHLTPVPFGLASVTTNNSNNNTNDGGQVKVQCLLQYYDELQGDFLTCAQFMLSESEPVTVPMPEVKAHNASQLVVSSMWKVLLLQSSAQGDAAVLPVSLAACMCVDSVFIPSLIPSIKASISLPVVHIRLCHNLNYNGSEIPCKLKRFHPRNDVVDEQEYAIVRFDNIHALACRIMGSNPRSSFKMSLINSLQVLDYTCLAMKQVLDPVHVAGEASLITSGQGPEMEVQIEMDKVCVRAGKNVVHTLNMAGAAWTSFSPSRQGPLIIFYHYVICNDTTSVIRFGQSGTDENISLRSKEMYAYSWRSFNMAQILHACMDQPSWRWTEPFPINTPGIWVREVKATDQDYALLVKVTRLSAVQLKVTITGQLLVSNQLSVPISVRVGVGDCDKASTGATSHQHQYTLQPGTYLPSLASSHLIACPIQLRLAGFHAPWSHEIYLSGDRMKEHHLVNIHLPGDSVSYFHIWCRIVCQHFQGKSQKLVLLTPLYVVRTHLPQPLFICLDSPKIKDNQELLVKSQGRDFQLHLQGGDVTHSMAFRLGPGMPMSSPPVLLSTGLMAQLERSGRGASDNCGQTTATSASQDDVIDRLCNLQLFTGRVKWPYLDMEEMRGKGGRGHEIHTEDINQGVVQKSSFTNDLELDLDASQMGLAYEQQQPSIDLSVQLCEYIPGCETLLVNVSPACLVTNVTELCVIIGEVLEIERQETRGGDGKNESKESDGVMNEGGGVLGEEREGEEREKEEDGAVGRRWVLNPGQTMSPPLPKDQFSVAITSKGQITATKNIPLSGHPMDYKRYNDDIGRVLFVDGYVQASFVIQESDGKDMDEVVFLTLTSDIQNGIRTICIRESFCVSNQHSMALTTKLLAIPKTFHRGSTSLSDTDTVTLTLDGKGQDEKEVVPIPRWSVLRTPTQDVVNTGGKAVDSLQQESLVFYAALALRGEKHGGVPIRITHSKESVRNTTSLPRFHPTLSSSSSSSSSTATQDNDDDAPNDTMITHAVCVTTHYRNGVYHLVIMEDTAPVLVVENLCPFGIQFGQACDQLRTGEVTIQEQLEFVSDLPFVSPGGWCHYTPPVVSSQFGVTETVTIPRINFREASHLSQWSSAVQISGTDAFVRLQDFCDIKIMIEVIGMVSHLVIRPVSKAEITAKEIRTRLKDGGGPQKYEVVNPTDLGDTEKHFKAGAVNFTNQKLTNVTSGEASVKSYSFSMDVIQKYSEREDVREKYLKKNSLNLNIGVLAKSMTLLLQDETYTTDANDILAVHLRDLFLASFPISKNPVEIVSKNCFALSVGYAQVDNQLCGSGDYDFPVVFIPQTQNNSKDFAKTKKKSKHKNKSDSKLATLSYLPSKTSVIESVALMRSKAIMHAQIVTLTDSIWGQFVIDVIDISIQPCSLYIDDSFVYRLIQELELLTPSKLSNPSNSAKLKSGGLANYSRLPERVFCAASELSQPVRIRTLTIHQIQMLLSIHASLKLFLASDHTPLNLGKFERQSVYSKPGRLVHSMTMHYASAAIFRAGIVVGSLEILGNPTGLVRSISAGVSDLISMPYSGLTRGPGAFVGGVSRGLTSFVRNVSAGMMTSMTNFASSMSRNMDRLSFDESHLERQEENRRRRPDGISQGVVQGLTGLGLSLLGAVAGLADQPLRSLVQSDSSSDQRAVSVASTATGLVAGVGKGLVGVLTKPIGGAAEFVSQTGQGILQGTGLGQTPTRLQPPPPSLHKQQQQQPLVWSSGFKYAVKVLTSLPSPMLYSFPAVTFDILGDEVKVVLVLTSDLIVVINVEEDAQQQTMSLSELVCRCRGDEEEEEDQKDAGSNEEVLACCDGINHKTSDGDDRDHQQEEKMGRFTLIWTDHYYNTCSIQHQQDASNKRIAAFIDSTQNVTGSSHPRCNYKKTHPTTPFDSKEPSSSFEHQHQQPHHHYKQQPFQLMAIAERQSDTMAVGIAPSPSSYHSGGKPILTRSLSGGTTSNQSVDKTNTTAAAGATTSCVKGQGRGHQGHHHDQKTTCSNNPNADQSPQYRFKMNQHWMRIFVTAFETAKHRLEGRGFSV